MRKREKRIRKELKRKGNSKLAGHGWAARQASKRSGR